jgi:hypothetical protein
MIATRRGSGMMGYSEKQWFFSGKRIAPFSIFKILKVDCARKRQR